MYNRFAFNLVACVLACVLLLFVVAATVDWFVASNGTSCVAGGGKQVHEAWSSVMGGADNNEVVVKAFNDMVSRGSLRTLRDGEWLGDEVLQQYRCMQQ